MITFTCDWFLKDRYYLLQLWVKIESSNFTFKIEVLVSVQEGEEVSTVSCIQNFWNKFKTILLFSVDWSLYKKLSKMNFLFP